MSALVTLVREVVDVTAGDAKLVVGEAFVVTDDAPGAPGQAVDVVDVIVLISWCFEQKLSAIPCMMAWSAGLHLDLMSCLILEKTPSLAHMQ